MKQPLQFLALTFALLLSSCAANAPYKLPDGSKMIVNGCVIEAAAMDASITETQKLNGTNYPHDVLLITYVVGGKSYGHAMWAFDYKGQVWIGDEGQGSFRVDAPWSPMPIARCAFAVPTSAVWFGDYQRKREPILIP
jgi:hypothetical protein